MTYEEFINSKRFAAVHSGFDVRHDQLNPALFQWQRDIVQWAIRCGRAALFLDCVAGETVIEGPDGSDEIAALATRGEPIRVWSLDRNGNRIAASATAPFRKGFASLYEVKLKSGRSVTATARHHVLTSDGWQPVSSLREGVFLAVQASGRELPSGLPVSISESFRQVFHGDARRCSNKVSNCEVDYSGDCRLGDEQLLLAGGIGLDIPPLQACVSRLSLLSRRMDAQGHKPTGSHPHRKTSRLSMRDSSDLDMNTAGVAECQLPAFDSASTVRSNRTALPAFSVPSLSQKAYGQSPSAIESFSACQSVPFSISYDEVVSVHYIRDDNYFDLHVPGFENYLANGIWHHNTGLGKTLQQLVWADEVCKHTGRRVLILCPLGVRHQTLREAAKFKIESPIKICADGIEVEDGITITNYDRLHLFDVSQFVGVIPDESSLLKSFTSKTREELTAKFERTPYKLPCTATPAPNDVMELANHAEFCGVMGRNEMLAMFFTHDGGSTSKWRLRGHAESKFWEWMATWAVMIRKPSDIGYDDAGYDLPPLNIIEHVVDTPIVKGHLFQASASTLHEQRAARRETLNPRINRMLEVLSLDEPSIVWCNLNDESTTATSALQTLAADEFRDIEIVEVTGSNVSEIKEARLERFAKGFARVLVSKPEIAGFGLNFQHCNQMAFLGLSHSYEQFYQAVRRCWRFGQKRPVTAHVIVSDRDDSILANIKRKQAEADKMARGMIEAMAGFTKKAIGTSRQSDPYATENTDIPEWLKGNHATNDPTELDSSEAEHGIAVRPPSEGGPWSSCFYLRPDRPGDKAAPVHRQEHSSI